MSFTSRFKPWQTTTAYCDFGEVTHHYDERGWHRLEFKGAVGVWASYADIATLKHNGTIFGATTEYFWPDMPEIFIIYSLKEHEIEEPETLQVEKKEEPVASSKFKLIRKGPS